MRISRWCYLVAVAALAAAVAAPATASALLTNEWGQAFNGGRKNASGTGCLNCHTAPYGATTHGQFAHVATDTSVAFPATGMWPVGLDGKGETFTSANVFSLGAGTGLQEFIKFGASTTAGVPFGVLTAEWSPANPSLWEVDGTAGVETEDYGCNQCHHVGATKVGYKPPAVGNFAPGGAFNDVTGTANAWAIESGADPAAFASYIPGSGIQCERCHGTGVAAGADAGGHWNSGVKIVGFNTADTKATAEAASQKVLKSEVCGQCHSTFKSGNIAGFTPDATMTDFASVYTLSDVPTAGAFTSKSKFFPSGQSNMHHSYYDEWALSGHSVRGALSKTATGAVTAYQASGASHFVAQQAGRVLCNRCHTGEGYLKRKLSVSAPLGNIMSGFQEASVSATPTNEGYLGQECATCHISHGATTTSDQAVGMSVRAPEKANGTYSTAGLNVDNKSICEDCHNWQVEVLSNNGTINSTPALPAILGKYVSHPQREVYHGRAMLEIPAGTDFMPGAKCEQCHMPATYSDAGAATGINRYADRDSKRYSHRMFIMMPGDAKLWGLAPWGDSCSPCHAGETQDQLQANIDNWQGTASDLANTASSTIAAAVARGNATSLGDIDLLKRASANLSLFVQDSSGGVHNFPYEKAGLEKAAELAASAGGSLTISAPTAAASNALFGIAGRALLGSGSGADGVTLTLWDGATKLGTTVADSNGNYSFGWASTASHTYTVLWERSSQSVSDLTASASVSISGAPAGSVATTLSLSRTKSTITHGSSVRFYGDLNPDAATASAPASIRVQYKKPGTSKWVTWRYVTTTGSGDYSTTWKTGSSTARGTWSWRTYFGARDNFLGDWSNTVTVHVN
jgi:hypothetical protein